MPNQSNTILAIIGRSVAIGAGALCLIATLLPSYGYDEDDSMSYWQQYERWDVVGALALIALIVIGVLALIRGGKPWDTLILILCGFTGGNHLFALVEHNDGTMFGAYLLSVGALIAIAAAVLVLLHLNGVGAPVRRAAQPAPYSQAPPAPVAQPAQSLPSAGWYRDPSGLSQQRYWDGRNWTEQLA